MQQGFGAVINLRTDYVNASLLKYFLFKRIERNCGFAGAEETTLNTNLEYLFLIIVR